MNWYIGQEIVCINAKNTNYLKEGNLYKINGLQSGKCKCAEVIVDIGINDGVGTSCHKCMIDISDDTIWFRESRFAPLEYDKKAIEELLENTLVKSV